MSTTYKTTTGDTFSTIARRTLGDDKKAGTIASANPGVIEPLRPGLSLTIPSEVFAQPPIAIGGAAENEVQIKINQNRFRYWTRIRINRSIDNMDSVEFIAPFEPDEISFRNAFVPMSFADVDITVGGDVLFSGTMVSPVTNSTADSTTVAVSCYSRCGVLQDCSMPSSSYPIEWRGQNIKQIAEKMLDPFGLGVIFDADPGPVFDKVAAKPDQAVYRFLAGLAKQRALIMSNTPQGNLLFLQSVQAGNPVVSLERGQTPLIGVRSAYNSQQYFSHVTGLKQRKVGSKGSQFTVGNPHIGPVIRPMTFTIQDGKKADPKISTNAEIGRMFARCVSYRISLDTWRDPSGNLWEPNTTITLEDSSNMIYSPYEFLIRNVVFDKTPNSETAQLTLVLPGCFSGEIPEALPWQT